MTQKSTFMILTMTSFSLVQLPLTAVVDTTSPTGRLALRASNAWFIMLLFVIILCYLFNIPVEFNLIEHCKDNEQNLNKRTFCSIFHLIQYYLTLSEDRTGYFQKYNSRKVTQMTKNGNARTVYVGSN